MIVGVFFSIFCFIFSFFCRNTSSVTTVYLSRIITYSLVTDGQTDRYTGRQADGQRSLSNMVLLPFWYGILKNNIQPKKYNTQNVRERNVKQWNNRSRTFAKGENVKFHKLVFFNFLFGKNFESCIHFKFSKSREYLHCDTCFWVCDERNCLQRYIDTTLGTYLI